MASPVGCVLVPFRELTPAQKTEAAALIRAAVPIYYRTLEDGEADRLIASEFDSPDGEMGNGYAALLEGQAVGIVCVYPLEELQERQFNSFQFLVRQLRPALAAAFIANAREIRAGLPPIEGEGEYLAFIAVANSVRGTGLADELLQEAVRRVKERPLHLTVRLDNVRALGFYRRHRFETVGQGAAFAHLRWLSD